MNCYIKENSFLARLAARKLGVKGVAIVFGKTIHLHNTSKEQFITNSGWVRHELAHIRQYRKHGFVGFIIRYVWESIRNGYHQNKYEIEAREAETDSTVGDGINIVI